MTVNTQIKDYMASQPEAKRNDMRELHKLIQGAMPKAKLWFMDGTDDNGKKITNPNIGYGQLTIKYADGSSRDFYQVGFSANTSGISVYIMGLKDKTYLVKTYGKKIGKATVTSYCIKFKALKDINTDVLKEAVTYAFKTTA